MANEALIRALQECRARHTDNEREEKNRLRIALSLQPEIGKLIDDRREDILRGLRLAIEGIHPGNIEERTKARNLQIRDLLKKANLPEDYLSPIFQCSECHDSGYVGQFQRSFVNVWLSATMHC